MATIHEIAVLREAKRSYGPRVYAVLLPHIVKRQKAGEIGWTALHEAFEAKRRGLMPGGDVA